MNIRKSDNTKRILLSTVVILLSMLSCGQYVTPTATTPTKTVVVTVDNTPTPLSPTKTETVPSATPFTEKILATVVTAVVNIHDKPEGLITGNLQSGDQVTVLLCENKWCQIENPPGWIWQGCLSENPEKLGCEAK